MPVDTPAWVRDAVFYQIFPDRFAISDRVPKPGPLEPWDAAPTNHGFKGGDLLGIVEHLDHIASLGCTALYLTPVFQSASNHRYHTYDYLAVDPLLGGDASLRELLDAAHARGMRVVLDGVFNHTGRGFWAFHHVLENGGGSPYRSWFHFDQAALDHGLPVDAYPDGTSRTNLAPGDHPQQAPNGGGSSLERYGYQGWWDMPALPKLNIEDPAVREHILGVAEHWLRFGIDGWRLDVPEEIPDGAFWAEFRRRCRQVNPEAYLVGEIWHLAPEWLAGDRFDAVMNYPLAQAILGYVGGESLNEPLLQSHHEYARVTRLDAGGFASRLTELLGAYDPAVIAVQLNLLDSHDAPRALSALGGDRRAMELAVLLQATLPGAPCTYYGDEVGLIGGLDPDNRRAMPWDQALWDTSLLDWTRRAFALRHAEPLLRHGEVRIAALSGEALVIERVVGGDRIAIALNPGREAARLRIAAGSASAEVLLATEPPPTLTAAGDGLEIDLPGRSGAVLRVVGG